MSRHPLVKWAQRSDKLFITIELPDAQDVKLKLEPEGKLFFSATSGAEKMPYELELELLDKVNVDESKARIGARNICYVVKKAENKWWGRLLKQKGKPPVFLTVDWDKWIDEDEDLSNKAPDDTDFGFDFPKLNIGDDEGLDGAGPDLDDDYDSDTEEENVAEASSMEKDKEMPSVEGPEEAPSTSSEPDTKMARNFPSDMLIH